jgi:hypothetical protein
MIRTSPSASEAVTVWLTICPTVACTVEDGLMLSTGLEFTKILSSCSNSDTMLMVFSATVLSLVTQ